MIAYIFPGQGSQKPGMGKDLYEAFPEAREVYDKSEQITGTNWAEISFEGDKEMLAQTQNTQPCLFIHSAALLHSLGDKAKYDGVGGHSLGEYTALYAAGVLSFEDALTSVVERGRLMSQARSGGMLAPIGADDEKLFDVVDSFKDKGVLVVANRNAPGQLVVSGDLGLLDEAAEEISQKTGARKVVKLPVSGAFHSPLMEDTGREMAKLLAKIQFNAPKVPFYANASGGKVETTEDIRKLLIAQITSPVLWIDQIGSMGRDGYGEFVEVGSGKVLQGLVSRILTDVSTRGISTAEDVAAEGT